MLHQKKIEKTIIFQPLALGIKLIGNCVKGLTPDSQVEHAGVQVGWKVHAINGKEMTNNKAEITEAMTQAKETGNDIEFTFALPIHVLQNVEQCCRKEHRMIFLKLSEDMICDTCWKLVRNMELLYCSKCDSGRCKECSLSNVKFDDLGDKYFDAKDFPQATFWFFQHKMHTLEGVAYAKISVASSKCGSKWNDFPEYLEKQHAAYKINKTTSWDTINALWNEKTPQDCKEPKLQRKQEQSPPSNTSPEEKISQ